jgi:hypothetical protein
MDVERELEAIKERNQRVEADKAWEQSGVRRLSIAALTYLFAVVWLFSINNDAPFLNAIIPVVGFLLSTLTLTFIKQLWQK